MSNLPIFNTEQGNTVPMNVEERQKRGRLYNVRSVIKRFIDCQKTF